MKCAEPTSQGIRWFEVFAYSSAHLKATDWEARTDITDGPPRVVTYPLKDLNSHEALRIRPRVREGGGWVLTVHVQGFKPW